jgi:hypothetical protein
MIGSLPLTLITGGLELSTAACILGKQILLSPRVPNYPMGSRRRRCGLFMLGAVLLYFGLETINLGLAGLRFSRPSGLVLMGTWCFVSETELETVMRQWLPERLQRRVHQLWDFASCKSAREMRRRRELDAAAVRPGVAVDAPPAKTVGAALVDLELSGWRVAGPNESAEVLDR